MKTVVQQIIEKFEHIQKNDCKTLPEHIFFDGVLSILQSVYMDIERDQLIDFGLKVKNEAGPEAYIKIRDLYTSTFETTNKETLK